MAVLIVCLEIFFCRIIDVTLGTVRTVLTVKEKPTYAALIGFIEAFVWFMVVRQALSADSSGIYTALAYAGGFSAGTFIGGKVASLVIKTNVTLQIVTTNKNDDLIVAVRSEGFGASVVDVKGSDYGCEKYMLFCEIPSSRLKELKGIVHKHDPKAFIMVQETKKVYNGFIKKK